MTPAVRQATHDARRILAFVAIGGATVAAIAAATGMSPADVSRRLLTNGPKAMNPAYKWFYRTGERWYLTPRGDEEVKKQAGVA